MDFLGNDAIEKLVKDFDFQTVLDIGCGAGNHAEFLASKGKTVTTLDAGHFYKFKPDILGDYETIDLGRKFDCIWASHILEHIRNLGSFLEKMYSDLNDGGVLAVSVPPLKHDLVSGHINLFNPGTLIYNLIQAGFDCSKASVKVYGYNISVIVKKVPTGIPLGSWSFADVSRFFPFHVYKDCDGRIISANW
ncbi:hypothetical protein SJ05684_c30630 [Sinorhizobium sojae CCBAU 05684]|uniref:Uncharacterized protein n=1 Tax=Sinorhizobium sojae CCBAU 05684 TaxID=716928 RepID=A0A249PFK2_9HYPH|nr:hypothetical protein SJ05684_c30630 [Sinorhizobium sojae CCBAU 05684]